MKRNTPESQVVKACMQWLCLHGCFVWRNNTGAWSIPNTGRLVRYGFPGSADILGVNPHGKFISVECKSPTGKKPTEQQEHFGRRVRENNGVYIVARSIDDLEANKAVLV